MKPIRKLKNNRWEVNEAWIKREIIKVNQGNEYYDMERDLIISHNNSNNGGLGCITFALGGSPPKGYAIYFTGELSDYGKLVIINRFTGKSKTFKEIIFKDSNKEILKKLEDNAPNSLLNLNELEKEIKIDESRIEEEVKNAKKKVIRSWDKGYDGRKFTDHVLEVDFRDIKISVLENHRGLVLNWIGKRVIGINNFGEIVHVSDKK